MWWRVRPEFTSQSNIEAHRVFFLRLVCWLRFCRWRSSLCLVSRVAFDAHCPFFLLFILNKLLPEMVMHHLLSSTWAKNPTVLDSFRLSNRSQAACVARRTLFSVKLFFWLTLFSVWDKVPCNNVIISGHMLKYSLSRVVPDEFVTALRDIIAPWASLTRNKPIDWNQVSPWESEYFWPSTYTSKAIFVLNCQCYM